MPNTPEPLDAIIAEMREYDNTPPPKRAWLDLADRIEAAYKREHAEWHAETEAAKEARNRVANRMRSEFAEKCRNCTERTPGNAAAMRDLLEKIRHEYGWGLIGCRTCVSSEADVERVSDLFEKQIDAALATPARNCDVGTEEEQHKRFKSFCEGHTTCAGCPFDFTDAITACPIEWGQMPFAPAEGCDHA